MISQVDDKSLRFHFEEVMDLKGNEDPETKFFCKFYSKGNCRRGDICPFKHESPTKTVVCKHWLRGLCKKNDQCEFLHEYNPKKMPECWFFAKFGECSSPDCIFLHVKPEDKIRACPWYIRGFCKHGPDCKYKHVPKVVCPDFLCGFCAKGDNCKFVHPSFDVPKEDPRAKREFRMGRMHGLSAGMRGKFVPRGHKRFTPGGSTNQTGKRDLSEVLCYKCKQMGHYANRCPNQRVGYGVPNQGAQRNYGVPRSYQTQPQSKMMNIPTSN